MSSTNGYHPPHSVDAEKAMLGSLLRDNTLVKECMGVVQPADCYALCNRIVYQAILDMVVEEASPADPITVVHCLTVFDFFVAKGWRFYEEEEIET